MGKKPVVGLAGMFLAGLALSGCQESRLGGCTSCRGDKAAHSTPGMVGSNNVQRTTTGGVAQTGGWTSQPVNTASSSPPGSSWGSAGRGGVKPGEAVLPGGSYNSTSSVPSMPAGYQGVGGTGGTSMVPSGSSSSAGYNMGTAGGAGYSTITTSGNSSYSPTPTGTGYPAGAAGVYGNGPTITRSTVPATGPVPSHSTTSGSMMTGAGAGYPDVPAPTVSPTLGRMPAPATLPEPSSVHSLPVAPVKPMSLITPPPAMPDQLPMPRGPGLP